MEGGGGGGTSELTHENDGRSALRSSLESIQDQGQKYITQKSALRAKSRRGVWGGRGVKHPGEGSGGYLVPQTKLLSLLFECAHIHTRAYARGETVSQLGVGACISSLFFFFSNPLPPRRRFFSVQAQRTGASASHRQMLRLLTERHSAASRFPRPGG